MNTQFRFQQAMAGIFFGNYFYGICAVALSVETALQFNNRLNGFAYYAVVFVLTVLYYTKAYAAPAAIKSANPRTQWYIQNRRLVGFTQWLFLLAGLAVGIGFAVQYSAAILKLPVFILLVLLQFPLVALLYYGIDNNIFPGFNLRRIGWLKPFLIGWVWAGLVTLYPLVYAHMVQQEPFALTQPVLLFFLQNFLFVSVISVMFDIKDYAADSNRQLKTFVVRNGLRKTIFALLIPLSVAGWAVYFLFLLNNGASMVILLLSSVPFLFLVLMANSLSQRRTILFYLVVIDGLMLVKALCGIVSALYF